MSVVCLDLEGVLVPEIWIEFAKKTGIDELKLTTRDISDYDVLMRRRLKILKENNLKLADIQNVIENISPLEGALEFTKKVKEIAQLVILSDTFDEFAKPLMRQLDYPTIFCNSLEVDKNNMISNYRIRINDGKKVAIEAFRKINLRTIASGDSYNDLSMIKTAHAGAFFRPPETIVKENPDILVCNNYQDLFKFIQENNK